MCRLKRLCHKSTLGDHYSALYFWAEKLTEFGLTKHMGTGENCSV